MTPLEIFDYKNKWMSNAGFSVRIHSDFDLEAKIWCRENLQQHQWLMRSWSDIYEHIFWFEQLDDSIKFMDKFYEVVIK